jgi:TatD DNase family protein
MASDAHAHPRDLLQRYPQAEEERRALGISCAASAWDPEEFLFQENLAKKALEDSAPAMRLCYAVHPQLPRSRAADQGGATGRGIATAQDGVTGRGGSDDKAAFDRMLRFLETLAEEKRISAVGETGFDLYDQSFRDTEAEQEALFSAHLEIALRFSLPLVLHIRKAMHKVFFHAKTLKRLPAVVLHSYAGSFREAGDLLKRGVNAFYSFGTTIQLNHKEAMRSCALLPAQRLLIETDAPYQPRGRAYSSWADLPAILLSAASLRQEAGSSCSAPEELEAVTDRNFKAVFGTD